VLLRLLLIAVLLASSPAHADVVSPPTLECPEGFPHAQCHGSEYCSIKTCATDAECGEGSTCAEQKWCIREFQCGRYFPDGMPVTILQAYEGSCANGGSCTKGDCKTVRACSLLPSRGCSCSLGLRHESTLGGLLLGLLAAALLLRRRGR